MRRVTISFAPGIEGFFGAGSAGLVVAFLKAASAVVHEPLVVRVRFGGFGIGVSPPRSALLAFVGYGSFHPLPRGDPHDARSATAWELAWPQVP
jgi:hypothetical protein